MSPKLLSRPNLSFLKAVATPHGVDSYLEQVDPLLVKKGSAEPRSSRSSAGPRRA